MNSAALTLRLSQILQRAGNDLLKVVKVKDAPTIGSLGIRSQVGAQEEQLVSALLKVPGSRRFHAANTSVPNKLYLLS